MKTAPRPRDAPDLYAAPDGTGALDEIFGALADPTRRAIVARLAEGPCSVSNLAAPFPISAPAITKHLAVLERAGMIARWKTGRVNYCRLVADPLGRAGAWIEQHRTFWEQQLDALENYLDRETETCNQPLPTPARLGIELQRRFRASPERVFRAWTQPVALREWWCPAGWTAGEIEIDLHVGGLYRISMIRAGDAGPGVSVAGQFLEVRPPERLVYTWRWEGAFTGMPETLVTLELRGSETETLLTLRHDNFTDAALRQQHRSGWIAACARLDRAMTPSRVLHDRPAAE